jgi:protein-S-isoprenylcysteine O-methyltransferase Ste14
MITTAPHRSRHTGWNLKELVGSGDRIALFAAPFVVVGVTLNVLHRSWFTVGGPPSVMLVVSIVVSAVGVVIWAWAVALILLRVPQGELITTGPFALMKHPIYTAAALLVLPWVGFLLDSWLGALVGLAFYAGSRRIAPAEEVELAQRFGPAWTAYTHTVKLPWL